jgi:hypothetical protein
MRMHTLSYSPHASGRFVKPREKNTKCRRPGSNPCRARGSPTCSLQDLTTADRVMTLPSESYIKVRVTWRDRTRFMNGVIKTFYSWNQLLGFPAQLTGGEDYCFYSGSFFFFFFFFFVFFFILLSRKRWGILLWFFTHMYVGWTGWIWYSSFEYWFPHLHKIYCFMAKFGQNDDKLRFRATPP